MLPLHESGDLRRPNRPSPCQKYGVALGCKKQGNVVEPDASTTALSALLVVLRQGAAQTRPVEVGPLPTVRHVGPTRRPSPADGVTFTGLVPKEQT